jgi:hypothetical protein
VSRRIAARLVTGPLAFGLGGVIDILGYAAVSLRARVRSARTARARSARDGPGAVR